MAKSFHDKTIYIHVICFHIENVFCYTTSTYICVCVDVCSICVFKQEYHYTLILMQRIDAVDFTSQWSCHGVLRKLFSSLDVHTELTSRGIVCVTNISKVDQFRPVCLVTFCFVLSFFSAVFFKSFRKRALLTMDMPFTEYLKCHALYFGSNDIELQNSPCTTHPLLH